MATCSNTSRYGFIDVLGNVSESCVCFCVVVCAVRQFTTPFQVQSPWPKYLPWYRRGRRYVFARRQRGWSGKYFRSTLDLNVPRARVSANCKSTARQHLSAKLWLESTSLVAAQLDGQDRDGQPWTFGTPSFSQLRLAIPRVPCSVFDCTSRWAAWPDTILVPQVPPALVCEMLRTLGYPT